MFAFTVTSLSLSLLLLLLLLLLCFAGYSASLVECSSPLLSLILLLILLLLLLCFAGYSVFLVECSSPLLSLILLLLCFVGYFSFLVECSSPLLLLLLLLLLLCFAWSAFLPSPEGPFITMSILFATPARFSYLRCCFSFLVFLCYLPDLTLYFSSFYFPLLILQLFYIFFLVSFFTLFSAVVHI